VHGQVAEADRERGIVGLVDRIRVDLGELAANRRVVVEVDVAPAVERGGRLDLPVAEGPDRGPRRDT
jgi:hypothetical protein